MKYVLEILETFSSKNVLSKLVIIKIFHVHERKNLETYQTPRYQAYLDENKMRAKSRDESVLSTQGGFRFHLILRLPILIVPVMII